MCSLLVLFVQCSLLHDHFFKEVPLGFENEHLAETLLMLLDAKPIIVAHLTFGNLLLIMAVHVQHRLVNISHLRLIGIVIALEMNLMLGIVGIEVRLGSFVQALQQFLVDQVLPFLIIEVSLVFIVDVFIV